MIINATISKTIAPMKNTMDTPNESPSSSIISKSFRNLMSHPNATRINAVIINAIGSSIINPPHQLKVRPKQWQTDRIL